MAKMRKFLFWNEAGDEKEKEALSLKKAVMAVQGDYKDKLISVEYVSKKGKQISTVNTKKIDARIKSGSVIGESNEAY